MADADPPPVTAPSKRHCGSCTLCCRLVPVAGLHKPAGRRCQHQRHTGCKIYPRRPDECRLWSCQWLADPAATAELHRPDRTHYVIDLLPDFVNIRETADDEPIRVWGVQVWIDPAYPEAWRDPALLRWLAKLGREQNMIALIRSDAMRATAVFPPALTADHQWHQLMAEVGQDVGMYSRLPAAARPPVPGLDPAGPRAPLSHAD